VDEARSFNEPVSNFGLHDQRTAFKWIQRFISGFGGDSNRVTAFGESAGSGSIAFHMCSDVPLFNRAILMSGLPSTLSPINLRHKEAEYRALLGFCGINEEDPDRLQKLKDVPAEKLVQSIMAVGMPMFHIYQDESFFSRGFPTYFTENELLAGCEWVDEIVIGDCFYEVGPLTIYW
jgi:carboxylesterase type B